MKSDAIPGTASDWKTLVDAWLHNPQNEGARRAFLAETPVLTPLQQRLLAELRERGFTHVAFSDLVEDGPQWPQLAREIEEWLQSGAIQEAEAAFHALDPDRRGKDDYLFRYYRRQAPQVTLPWACPWLQVAITPPILDLVNHYLTLMSHVINIDLWYTFPDARPSRRVASQRWHRDGRYHRIVKAFLYFTDVDRDNGALEYVPFSRKTDDKFGNVWTQDQHRGGYAPADEFESRIPPTEWVTCAYPAGTLVIADTSGYHRGGRAVSRHRVFATFAWAAQTETETHFVVDPAGVPAGLSTAARFALFGRADSVPPLQGA